MDCPLSFLSNAFLLRIAQSRSVCLRVSEPQIDTEVGKGTAMSILLPRFTGDLETGPHDGSSRPPACRTQRSIVRLLIVELELGVCQRGLMWSAWSVVSTPRRPQHWHLAPWSLSAR
jgi:hypothetical protein